MSMTKIKYTHTEEIHNTNSPLAFVPLLKKYSNPASVLDVGCGTGSWLKVFKDFGTKTVLGIDGPNVNPDMLVIEKSEFLIHDLREPLSLNKKFDLALCLEVAEHLPEEAADIVIELLTSHTDTILFSAALRRQGGQNHINEQPFTYWVQKFNKKGFVVHDFFRATIWEDPNIEWWYRQNMFLVTKQVNAAQQLIHDYYHPELYISTIMELESATITLNILKEEHWNMVKGKLPVSRACKILVRSLLNFFKRADTK